jgi:hypothetical protein
VAVRGGGSRGGSARWRLAAVGRLTARARWLAAGMGGNEQRRDAEKKRATRLSPSSAPRSVAPS